MASRYGLREFSDDEASAWNRLETCLLKCQVGNFPISIIGYWRKVTVGVHNFSKNPRVTSKFWFCQAVTSLSIKKELIVQESDYSATSRSSYSLTFLQLLMVLLLLQSALQPLVGFGLFYDFVPQSSIFTLLSLSLSVSLSSFSLSSSLNPLLLGQAISILFFLLVLMNMVPIQLIF